MNDTVAVSEAKTLAWTAEFKNEPPLHTLLPMKLANGESVPSVHVVCMRCGNRISGDRVHGRLIQHLPHVLTVSATGYCQQCEHLTHVDCRFRFNQMGTVVEWLAANGHWQARELRQPTLAEKVARGARRLAAWFAKTS